MQFTSTIRTLIPLITLLMKVAAQDPSTCELRAIDESDRSLHWYGPNDLNMIELSPSRMEGKYDLNSNGHIYTITAKTGNSGITTVGCTSLEGDSTKQFKVSFLDFNDQVVKSFWITKDHNCSAKDVLEWGQTGKRITVQERAP
jgi:hypothetical protein